MVMKNKSIAVLASAMVLLLAGVAQGEPQVPCFFIFGDSLSDSGNNNPLSSTAKANFPPYGIDFPGGFTGRFTNGRTTVDLIGDHMGLPSYINPFASISDADMVRGVNYASGSAGILEETGNSVGQRVPMNQQLENHQTAINKITAILGKDKVQAHLNKCLYSVYAGSNDYMLNYFMQKSTTLTPEKFTESLVPRYVEQLKRIYGYGARKVVIFGLGPLGCLPMQNSSGGCSIYINDVLDKLFNRKLKTLVDEFNRDLKGSQFIFVDSMRIISPDLKNLGLPVNFIACCGTGQIWCTPYSTPCFDRNDYAYWDGAHPTEVANKVLANKAYSTQDPLDAYPFDIQHLVTAKASVRSNNIVY